MIIQSQIAFGKKSLNHIYDNIKLCLLLLVIICITIGCEESKQTTYFVAPWYSAETEITKLRNSTNSKDFDRPHAYNYMELKTGITSYVRIRQNNIPLLPAPGFLSKENHYYYGFAKENEVFEYLDYRIVRTEPIIGDIYNETWYHVKLIDGNVAWILGEKTSNMFGTTYGKIYVSQYSVPQDKNDISPYVILLLKIIIALIVGVLGYKLVTFLAAGYFASPQAGYSSHTNKNSSNNWNGNIASDGSAFAHQKTVSELEYRRIVFEELNLLFQVVHNTVKECKNSSRPALLFELGKIQDTLNSQGFDDIFNCESRNVFELCLDEIKIQLISIQDRALVIEKKDPTLIKTEKEAYEALGLTPPVSKEQIKRQFRKLQIIVHPDKNPNDPKATEKSQRLNNAYTYLKTELKFT